MKAIAYLRVSTQEQARSGLGLAAQRIAIETEARRRGWSVTVYVDDGWSAGSLSRPALQEALRALKRGEAEALVVAKLDRLSRSLVDFAGLMDVSRREGWALVALDLGIDTTTPAGELVANVMASVAQWERRVIAQRTKEALAAAKQRGVHVGRRSTLPPEVVERVRVRRAQGLTLRAIAAELNAEGVPTGQGGAEWRANSVSLVLKPKVVNSLSTDVA
ncbi:MAG: recombinase family protein [Actinobacteria bacterium]|nr:recombinase family protein [Actinomycetota bacterium]